MFGNKPAQGSSTPQTANIGASIRIKGEIDSPEHVFLAGSLDGDIVVERLQIKSNAVVKGSLTYKSIEVAEGAQIDGNFVQVTQKPRKDAVTLPKTKK